MVRIGIGINENVVIKSLSMLKETLVLELVFAATEKKSLFDQQMTAGIVNTESGTQIRMFGFKIPTIKDATNERKLELTTADIVRTRNQMTHMLEQFILRDNIQLYQNQFNNTGIVDSVTYEKLLLDQDRLTKIYNNLCSQFMDQMKPFLNNPEHAVRIKLIRQSKDKNFPTLSSSYLDEQPFMELMSVPVGISKVKFNKYEIDNGLNSDVPVSVATAEAKTAAPAANGAPLANPFDAPVGQ